MGAIGGYMLFACKMDEVVGIRRPCFGLGDVGKRTCYTVFIVRFVTVVMTLVVCYGGGIDINPVFV